MNLRALLFDLGNVLVGLDFERAYHAAEKLSRYSAAEIPQVLRRTGLSRIYEQGEITSEDFYRRFTTALEMEISYEEFRRLWGDMFQPEPLISEDWLAELHRGYRLLLLSNTNELHFEWIRERYPLLRHFDDYVVSYRVGAMKPEAAIYHAAVELAQCEAGECFFTDDKPENVEGARRLGIDAEVFLGEADLCRRLRERGVG